MSRSRGRGVGPGMALGTAVVVRKRGGVSIVPSPPERPPVDRVRRPNPEPPDIVLVADDYETAVALIPMLAWANSVGIVARIDAGSYSSVAIPAVLGLGDGLIEIEDGSLLLVDAERGVVLVDPDSVSVARYQAEHDHIAPRRRLYLGSEHLPAVTIDGQSVTVGAILTAPDSIDIAMASGADLLCVEASSLTMGEGSPEIEIEIERALDGLCELAAGKPILLFDAFTLPAAALLQAADRSDLTVAEPPRFDLPGLGIAELNQEWAEAETDLLDAEKPYARPRIAAWLPTLPNGREIEQLLNAGSTRLIYAPANPPDANEDQLIAIARAAAASDLGLTPLFCSIGALVRWEDTGSEAIARALALGVTGLLVAPESVAATKEAIRALSASECRDTLRGELGAVAHG